MTVQRARHDLRWHCECRLPGQCLEVRTEGYLRDNSDAKGYGFARAHQILT